jgi:hypothetical protein
LKVGWLACSARAPETANGSIIAPRNASAATPTLHTHFDAIGGSFA